MGGSILGNVLTFGWFDSAFLSMSEHKLAILANLISAFSNVGIIGSAKTFCDNNTHKTQNTKTHKNQHELPPPYPQRLCCLMPWQHPPWHQLLAQRLPPCEPVAGACRWVHTHHWLFACRHKWWPKWHPSSTTGAQTYE